MFIVEDHPVFREGLAQTIKSEDGLNVCGGAGNVATALRDIARLKPDLVLVDIGLPGRNGLELIKHIRRTNRTIKLLVVSMHDEALYADRVLRAGGDGYVMKQESPEEIVHAIRDVLGGHIYVSEEVLGNAANGTSKHSSKDVSRPLDQLSDVELQVLECLGRGKSNQELASQIRTNVRQVAAYCNQIKRKLKLKTTNALIRYAVCWVESGEN